MSSLTVIESNTLKLPEGINAVIDSLTITSLETEASPKGIIVVILSETLIPSETSALLINCGVVASLTTMESKTSML